MARKEIVKTGTYGMVRRGTTTPVVTSTLIQKAPANAIRLDTGEYVSRVAYNSLTQSQRVYLRKHGIAAFNREQAQEGKQKIAAIESYKSGEGYDLVAMLESGYTPDKLRGLGFSQANITKAEDIVAEKNKPGGEIFADLQARGDIPKDAEYQSYNKDTGVVNYVVPDTRTGKEIFQDLQSQGIIRQDATYVGFDTDTREISYKEPRAKYGETEKKEIVTSNADELALAGAVATLAIPRAIGMGMVAFPEPISSVLGAVIIGVTTYFAARKIKEVVDKQRESTTTTTGDMEPVTSMSDVVVTTQSGAAPFTLQNIAREWQPSGIPLEAETSLDMRTLIENIKPLDLRTILEQEHLEPGGIPLPAEERVAITRFPTESDPLEQGKARDVLAAAIAASQAAQNVEKTMPVTRKQWDTLWEQVNEHLRQGRVAKGKEILRELEGEADTPSIARSYRLAYEDYLRKKAILEAARKTYVASLNPEPIKGKGTADATAAAVGIWLVTDILRNRVAEALQRGDSIKEALESAREDIKDTTKELGLTQHQVDMSVATVVYEATLQSMVAEAVKAASEAQAKGQTQSQVKQAAMEAAQTQLDTMIDQAVASKALPKARARELTDVLENVAENVGELTGNFKLPPPFSSKDKKGKRPVYPAGTITWRMGETRRGDEWKIIPPPYNLRKPISSTEPPKGVKVTKGTPQQTLTFIKGKTPFADVSFDLGIVDGHIDVKKKKIVFAGEGEKTDVGKRVSGSTKGISIPAVINERWRAVKGKRKKRSSARRPMMASVSVGK